VIACGQAVVARRDGLRDGRCLQRRHQKKEQRKLVRLLGLNLRRIACYFDLIALVLRLSFALSLAAHARQKCISVWLVRAAPLKSERGAVNLNVITPFVGDWP
jgi:hypothetical protein